MITAQVETITPELAAKYLAKAIPNRAVVRVLVERYARAMREGQWALNGEPIIFDQNGDLSDGQHRLHAVIAANITIKSMVVRGVATSTFDTMNVGRQRKLAEILTMKGREHGKELGATLTLLWRYDTGTISSTPTPNVGDCEGALERYPIVEQAVTSCMAARDIMSPSILAFVYSVGYQLDKDTPELFIDSFVSGANLQFDDPVRLLRERCLQRKRRIERLARVYQIALTIKAYNYFASGLPLQRLSWIEGESFPQIGALINTTTGRRKLAQITRRG